MWVADYSWVTSSVGIDISGFQDPAVVTADDWLFVVVKITEGNWYSNPRFSQQWAAIRPGVLRGVYHYARPAKGDGVTQARFFADAALAAGFRPDVDLWQLDVEGNLNETVDGVTWARFVSMFMETALGRLGRRGFLYVGAYFFEAELLAARGKYPWWLPFYGHNDGTIATLPGLNPVVHQYTSVGGLDRNVIHDQAAWDALVATPTPAPLPIDPEDPVVLHVHRLSPSQYVVVTERGAMADVTAIEATAAHLFGPPVDADAAQWHDLGVLNKALSQAQPAGPATVVVP